MSKRELKEFQLMAPYRVVPESSRRIQRTQLIMLIFPGAAGYMFFGTEALKLMLASVVAAGVTEFLIQRGRHVRVPGNVSHSIMMGLLVAFMLPANCGIKIAVIGAVVAVVVGKQFFGGLGHYVWHPALVGRLVVQIFYSGVLSRNTGPLLSRNRIFLGDVNEVGKEAATWFRVAVASPPTPVIRCWAPWPTTVAGRSPTLCCRAARRSMLSPWLAARLR